nr:hypothetical protein [Tanacetum cinerariifolium]
MGYGDYQIGNVTISQGLVRGLPKLKFEKDHLCSACTMSKSTKKTHKPKFKDTNQEKLYLLHMDLYGPMRVENVNGKKYILVIVDDYSRFTWVKFLRSKDETPDFIIKFLKMIQRLWQPPVLLKTDPLFAFDMERLLMSFCTFMERACVLHEPDGVRSQWHHIVPIRELNGVLIALVARSGVISKSTDRILVFHGG